MFSWVDAFYSVEMSLTHYRPDAITTMDVFQHLEAQGAKFWGNFVQERVRNIVIESLHHLKRRIVSNLFFCLSGHVFMPQYGQKNDVKLYDRREHAQNHLI